MTYPDPDQFVRDDCGCGYEIVCTPDGWQHDSAPWFWGGDHDPQPDQEAQQAALRWLVDTCSHVFDEEYEGARCANCGIAITWDLEDTAWIPAPGSIPWVTDKEGD